MASSRCSSCGSTSPCSCSVVVRLPRWMSGYGPPQEAGYPGDQYVDKRTGLIWQREVDRWFNTGVSFALAKSGVDVPEYGYENNGNVLTVTNDGLSLEWSADLHTDVKSLEKRLSALQAGLEKAMHDAVDMSLEWKRRLELLEHKYEQRVDKLDAEIGVLEAILDDSMFRRDVNSINDLPRTHKGEMSANGHIYYVRDEYRFYKNVAGQWIPISQAPLPAGLPAQSIVEQEPVVVPGTEAFFVVSQQAIGPWAAHRGQTAWWDGAHWSFRDPYVNEMHVVLDENAIYKWNGLVWAKAADLTGTLVRPQMIFVGEGAYGLDYTQTPPVAFATGAAPVWDATNRWGMPPGTLPDPAQNEPQPNDIYIDTLADRIYILAG